MKIPILMYHQIDTPPARGTTLRGLIVSPGSFSRQMLLLKCLGYQGLSMRDLEPYLCGEKQGKVVGITFDDGYQNNVVNALPILKKHGFTATCYGVSSMIGGTNVWDKDTGIAQKSLMTATEWETWIHSGMDVGSHTRTHVDLTQLSTTEAFDQMASSKRELENILGCEVRHFCYPYGRFTDAHAQMATQAGYITSTTTRRGRSQSGDDLQKLHRVLVARATTLMHFALKITTTYEDKRG